MDEILQGPFPALTNFEVAELYPMEEPSDRVVSLQLHVLDLEGAEKRIEFVQGYSC